MREDLYSISYENPADAEKKKAHFSQQHAPWRTQLKLLYVKILKFQATCICHISKGTASRTGLDAVLWNNWDDLRAEIESQRGNLESIEGQWRDFKLQERWNDEQQRHNETISTLGPMADEMTRIRTVVEQTQKDQVRQDLLRWISEYDFSSRYNDIRDRREKLTGDWLLKHGVYKDWKITPSSFLWLFGNGM